MLADHIAAAWERRAHLHHDDDTSAYRLLHGWDEGAPGLEIDRYGESCVLRYPPDCADRLEEIAAALERLHGFARIVAKPRRARAVELLRGALPDAPHEVRELGLRFAVDPGALGNPGLYLDARPARMWLRRHSEGRRVLNLFAFTGSLGVAAIAGGARSVTHIDSRRAALEACRRNHELNQQHVDDRDLVRLNVHQHLRRQSAGRQRFGGILLDAPPLSELASKSDRTPGPRGAAGLAPLAARMLEPGGWLLCFFHHGAPRAELEDQVLAASEVPLEILWRGESGDDFPSEDPTRTLRLTAFVRR